MKRLLTLILVIVPLLGMAQDDLYFTSSKKAKEETQKRNEERREALRATTTSVATAPAVVDYNSNTRSEDEYNRRYVYGGQYQNAGGAAMDDSLAARVDSVEESYAESEYDMDDPELDYRFSRRLVRFHNPRLYALASPYYWDLYYGYGAWDYLYDPYDPWYWHYGWSYGWTWGPWDCWYGGIWGWHRPYAWTYWGWGPSWSRPVYYVTYHRNVVPREFNSSRGHMSANNRIRTNALGGRTNALGGARTNALGGGARTNALGGARTNALGGARTNAVATRTGAQDGVETGRRSSNSSYTDYTNVRTGRSSAAAEGARSQTYNRTREGANQRSTIIRGKGATRSYSNQNSSSRTNSVRSYDNSNTRTQTQTRTQTPTYSTPSRSTMSSGSFGGGGSVSRSGGSFGGGGGGSRGGGAGGGGRR